MVLKNGVIKFKYSEKATQFDEISILVLTLLSIRWSFLQMWPSQKTSTLNIQAAAYHGALMVLEGKYCIL